MWQHTYRIQIILHVSLMWIHAGTAVPARDRTIRPRTIAHAKSLKKKQIFFLVQFWWISVLYKPKYSEFLNLVFEKVFVYSKRIWNWLMKGIAFEKSPQNRHWKRPVCTNVYIVYINQYWITNHLWRTSEHSQGFNYLTFLLIQCKKNIFH